MRYIPKYQRAGKLPLLPAYNYQAVQDNTTRRPVETDIILKERQIKRGHDLRIKEKQEALAKYRNQPGMISGMKLKPTQSDLKEYAMQAVSYNDKLRNDPVRTLGPDIAISMVPELLMMRGPQQIIGKGLDYINPFKKSLKSISANKVTNVTKNGYFGDVLWDGLLPRITRGDLPKGGYYRKIGNEKGLKDLINSGEVRTPVGESNFTGTSGTYFSKNNPIEDYEGRFLVHHPGEGELKTIFDGVQDKKFYIPSDKQYPLSTTPVRLDDPKTTLYKRRFMTTSYKKIDKDKLEDALKNVDKYENTEQILRFGLRWGGREEVGRNSYKNYQNWKNNYGKDKK